MRKIFEGAGRPDFAIDFGTANTRVVTGSGLVFDEPSLCCFSGNTDRGELVAAGSVVSPMQERTSGTMKIRRPLSRGVVSDLVAARDYLAYAVRASVGQRRLRSFRSAISVPADATMAERSALLTAAKDAGIGSVQLLAEPLVAAMGANLPINLSRGSMIVEYGAGTTEAAVMSLGGMCATASVRGGGNALDKAIADYLHFRHKFLIGISTAEAVKRRLIAILTGGVDQYTDIPIKGRNLVNGLPEAKNIPISELQLVVDKHVAPITTMIVSLLSQIPPELSGDVHDGGIVLTGGNAATGLIRPAISEATGLRVTLADNPAHCVALGLHKFLTY